MNKPILKWPGAKWRLAPWIVSHFPAHAIYVEPYSGSAACYFAKDQAPYSVLNDLDGSIVNLFRVLRDHGEELARLVALTPWSRAEYELSEQQHSGTGDSVEDARRFLVRCWQAHGTRFSYSSGWRNRGVQGGLGSVSTTQGWKQVPERLLSVIDLLKDAEIEHRPALEVIARYNAAEVLLYVDPPYLLSTRSGAYYTHEMSDKDHRDLLQEICKHRGPVVLSGYAHLLYEEHLSGWYRISIPSLAEKGAKRTEVLWLNEKAITAQQLPLFAQK